MLPVELCPKFKLNLGNSSLKGTSSNYLNMAFKGTISQHNIKTKSSAMSLHMFKCLTGNSLFLFNDLNDQDESPYILL